jgi:hypothetical protein
MVIGLIFFVVWDVIVAHNAVSDDTISEITRDLSTVIYTIPYICGIVMGHLFWNAPDRERLNLKIITASTVGVTIFDLVAMPFPGGNLLFFVVGFGIGAYFWPQKVKNADDS